MQTPATLPSGGDGGSAFLKSAPPIPDAAFERLPSLLVDALSYFDRPSARSVLLLGSLPVLASLISRGVVIPHKDGLVSPDLYVCIVAPPASGKGALKWAKRLGLDTHERLCADYDTAYAAWKALPVKDRAQEEEPRRRLLYLPGNVSATRMVQLLDEAGGHALTFEEEIDTMASALAQDWGNYSDVSRKAFHHEPVSIERKTERAYIARPCLSMVLSGTLGQMVTLIQSAENGLFSRYGFFYFEDYQGWTSHRPTLRVDDRERFFRESAAYLDDLHALLSMRRDRPVRVVMSREHWDEHDRFFAEAHRRLISGGLPQALTANVRRAGLTAVRIAATLATVRAYDGGTDLSRVDTVHVSGDDLEAALLLSQTFLEHAARFYTLLQQTPASTGVSPDALRLFHAMPEGEVTPADFDAAWRSIDVSRATAFRYKGALVDAGLLVEVPGRRGVYVKRPPEASAPGLVRSVQEDETGDYETT